MLQRKGGRCGGYYTINQYSRVMVRKATVMSVRYHGLYSSNFKPPLNFWWLDFTLTNSETEIAYKAYTINSVL